MALSDKKYDTIHTKTGSDKDKLKDEFDAGYLTKISDILAGILISIPGFNFMLSLLTFWGLAVAITHHKFTSP